MVHVDQKDDSQEGSQSIVYKQLMKCGQKQIDHKSIISSRVTPISAQIRAGPELTLSRSSDQACSVDGLPAGKSRSRTHSLQNRG